MAFIRIIVLLLAFSITSCNHPVPLGNSNPSSIDSISNSIIDSIGELAYDNYESYSKNPEAFLSPLDNKVLSRSQKETYLWILINMGYGFQTNSKILSSCVFYEKALLIDLELNFLTEEDRLTYINKPLSNNYTMLSDYEKAERLQLAGISASSSAEIKASYYNNLSLLYSFKDEFENSKQAAITGLTLTRKDKRLELYLINSLTKSFLSLNQIDSAKIANQNAFEILDMVSIDKDFAAGKRTTLQLKAELAILEDNRKSAISFLNQALELELLHYPNSHYREKANLYNLIGEQLLYFEQKRSAKKHFDQALSLLNENISEVRTSSYTKVNLLKNLGILYAKHDIDSSLSYFEQAIISDFAYQQNVTSKKSHILGNQWNRKLLDVVYLNLHPINTFSQEQLTKLLWLTELTKGRLLWNDINRSINWKVSIDSLGSIISELQKLYIKRDLLNDSSERIQVETMIQNLNSDFDLKEQYFTREIHIPTFDSFRKSLFNKINNCYAYFIHEDKTISVFHLFNNRVAYFHLQDKKIIDSIISFKETYFSYSPNEFNENPAKYFKIAANFKELLLPGLEQQTNICLSLDNELYLLPFDALSDGQEFIVEGHDIQYQHSLLFNSLIRKDKFSNQQITILFRDKYAPPLSDLPFVTMEVKSLKRNFEVNILPSEKLSLETLLAVLQKNAVLHVAAHTIIEEDQEAKLILHQPISTDQLRHYDFHAPLVVLSACNTASGKILPSEGMASIHRAFLSKGVPGVLATHWYANDAITLKIMDNFYVALSKTNNPIKSISTAKRHYLKNSNEHNRNPWYWANMAYYGIETEIELQSPFWKRASYGFLSLSIVLFFIAIIKKARKL